VVDGFSQVTNSKKKNEAPIWMLDSSFLATQYEFCLNEGNKDVGRFQRLGDKFAILEERAGIQ
jgi:hypothetical protein